MEQVIALRTPEAVLEALAAGTRLGNEGQFPVHEAIRKDLPSHEHGEELWERATADHRDALHAAARHLHTLTPPPAWHGRRGGGPAVVLVRPQRPAHAGGRERLGLGPGREVPAPDRGRHPVLRPAPAAMTGAPSAHDEGGTRKSRPNPANARLRARQGSTADARPHGADG